MMTTATPPDVGSLLAAAGSRAAGVGLADAPAGRGAPHRPCHRTRALLGARPSGIGGRGRRGRRIPQRARAAGDGGEPIAYIRGFKEWLSLRIRTDPRALVPRPETEILAAAAMTEVAGRLEHDGEPVVAWEVATGSGAVAVALALRFREALEAGGLTLIASDASADALALAAENLAEHGVERLLALVSADLLAPAGASLPRPGVIVANLPYLSTAEVEAAAGSLAHEPRVALEGGTEGLELLRRLFAELPQHAAPGATVLLEVALGQAEAVVGLAPPGAAVETLPDLGGVPRVVIVRVPS